MSLRISTIYVFWSGEFHDLHKENKNTKIWLYLRASKLTFTRYG